MLRGYVNVLCYNVPMSIYSVYTTSMHTGTKLKCVLLRGARTSATNNT